MNDNVLTEQDGYKLLCKPYISTSEISRLLRVTPNTVSKIMSRLHVDRISRGAYVTASVIEKCSLQAYWEQVKRYAETT